MAVLEHLEPKAVFDYFEQLCAIPHGSGNTAAVSDWLMAFGAEHGLEAHRDAAGNVILASPAAPGYEDAPTVILQGHTDMVCEQAPDCAKDMAREGLDLAVEGDLVYARGTTLGGDDGIAVAMMMAVLADREMPRPRVEGLFTVDEEVGMLGAAALDASPLRGRTLINLDSEEEGIFTVSCAGGNVTCCVLPVRREPFAGTALRLRVSGLQGGHSGVEIHKGRGNADMLLGRVLFAARGADLRLVSLRGGTKDNAIPREAEAVLVAADEAAFRTACAGMDALLKDEYRVTDPAVAVTVEAAECGDLPMAKAPTERTVCMLTCLPNGPQTRSADIPGLVQASLNLGILESDGESVSASFCVRSSVASQEDMLTDRLACLMGQLGGSAEVSDHYPGWAYRPDSPLREKMVEVFRRLYGREPAIEAVHAGLECGMLAEALPGLDCVSMGPDLEEVHTCRERLHIASVQRTWDFLREVLKELR